MGTWGGGGDGGIEVLFEWNQEEEDEDPMELTQSSSKICCYQMLMMFLWLELNMLT